ncbi:MAG: DUF29 domain-containing protein [Desulfobacteraceae bacterium]|nr:DUF29 domain-containing protein [Desulfobacteraceae bacterium]
MSQSVNYDQDFYSWLLHNAQLLRHGRFTEADIENIAEELESMGKRDKRELISRFAVLLAHLLKWQYQADRRSKSWEKTIDEQRIQIHLILEDSPSLKYQLEQRIADGYRLAIKKAVKETGLKPNVFSEKCPYSLELILDENFYPGNM